MTRLFEFKNCIVLLIVLIATSTAVAGSKVEIRTASGARWNGEIGDTVEITFHQQRTAATIVGELMQVADLYIKVEGEIAGKKAKKVIFKSDIISITSMEPAKTDKAAPPAATSGPAAKKPAARQDAKESVEAKAPKGPGVYFLPLEGMVGTSLRHEEIEKIGEHADKAGPGQIIVFSIASNGGLVSEGLQIRDAIFDLSSRHRVVAWIQKALSGGAYTAMCCDEMYFTTEGVCGSITMISGSQAIQGEAQNLWTESLVETVVRQGYSEHIGRCMTASRYMCSYDKDEETGEVTFYGDMSGEHVLSDDKSNLCFNASNALECGFSKGTADTEEELAKLLQLPEWREVDDYGRKIAKEWQETCERAEKEIPMIAQRLSYKGTGSGDSVVIIGSQIKLLKQLVRWWDRCPNVARMNLPPKEDLERQIDELRRQLRKIQGGR